MNSDKPAAKSAYHHGDLRRALLAAAEAELEEKGVEGFTLRGCAKRAGVSHAAPTHHFGDVTGLLTALAAEGFQRFLATTTARLTKADSTDGRGRMAALGLGYVEFARANPALFRLMFSSDRPDFDDEALGTAASTAFEQLVSGVGGVEGSDPLDSRRGRRIVAARWAMVHGLAHLLLSRQMKFLGEGDEEALQEDLSAILSSMTYD